jgi:Cu/Ag efflux pump CusA
MALGLGEGGEQNAPLGRAVIGGLIFATTATLMFVPVVFSMVHKKQDAQGAQATGVQDTKDSASPEMLHAH